MSHPTSSPTPAAAQPPRQPSPPQASQPPSTQAPSVENDDRGLAGEVYRALPRVVRGALVLLAGLAILLVVTSLVGVWVLRQPLPQTSGELRVSGLVSRVIVYRDDRGVPTLAGDSDLDLFRAQGYVHAQDRFFEMDLRRHAASGRLSELFGEPTLAADKVVRTMGWRRVAAEEVARLDLRTRDALEAYAAGVNAYLDQRSPAQLGLEYTMLRLDGLRYHPEPWSPVDTLSWLKALAWDLNGGAQQEMGRVAALLSHSPAEVAQLYPAYDSAARAPIVDQGAVVDGVFDQDATRNATRLPTRPSYPWAVRRALLSANEALTMAPRMVGSGEGIGSNSWVVSGGRSATGAPLLASDPHLAVSQPGALVQGGLKCAERSTDCTLDVTGFSFAGVPGVAMGHNADIAWGLTNLPADTTDFFLESVEGGSAKFDDRQEPLETRRETIKVRGGEDFELTIRESRHGPLISDVSAAFSTMGANSPAQEPDAGDPEIREQPGRSVDEAWRPPYAVALSWTGLQPARTMDGLLALNRAEDFADFRSAASHLTVPSLSLVYADRAGQIGYQATGKIPIRRAGQDGSLPVEGWQPANEWTGTTVPAAALPNVVDPAAGILVAANQQVISERYPYDLGSTFDQGYRSQRIVDLLDSDEPISQVQVEAIQRDNHNPLAALLVPALLKVDPGAGSFRDAQQLLTEWDYADDADSAAAAYFNATWAVLLRVTFNDELPVAARPTGGARWVRVMSELLDAPHATWWDDKRTDDVIESRDDMLRLALREARVQLTSVRSPEVKEWRWGDLHRLAPQHPAFGDSTWGLARWLFNGDAHDAAGGSAVVNATAWDAGEVAGAQGFGVTSAPAMRMVIDLGDWENSRWVALTGVSGHPGSRHYRDQTDDLIEGRSEPWPFTLEQVREAADDTLELTPR